MAKSKGASSRAKGAKWERDVAAWFRENLHIEARRGQQYSGSPDSPDVITSIDRIHVEAKARERLNVHLAMEQAIADAGTKIPVIIHRKNYYPPMVTVLLGDLVEFCHEITKACQSRVD